jgi:CMP/dCMP kinase
MIVAIDGPAGAGKSTVARRLAERLGFRYLDTGAMYRALTWLALDRGLDLEDTESLVALAREHPVVFEAPNRVLIGDDDVTQPIREPRIDRAVPVVARQQPVRAIMRERQRELGEEGDSVIEGRDIGKVVAPGAEVKVYLVADAAERARRRLAERPGLGADALATDLKMRDASDAPQMEPAEDAVQLDTTQLTIDQVVDRIEGLVRSAAAGVR